MGIAEGIDTMDFSSQVKPDRLAQLQTKRCREVIGMALSSYSPGLETHSSSGVPCVIYGEHLWVFLGFTPCESVRTLLKDEYNAVFGKLVSVDSTEKQESTTNNDFGFAYGTPFVGIPLPR